MSRRGTFSVYVDVDIRDALEAATDDQIVAEVQRRIDEREWSPKKQVFDLPEQKSSEPPPEIEEAQWRLQRGELGRASRLIARAFPIFRDLPYLVEKTGTPT